MKVIGIKLQVYKQELLLYAFQGNNETNIVSNPLQIYFVQF